MMGVITISATASTRQLVNGIPQTVTLATNVSAIIFYTLDGTEPTMSSLVYTQPIEMPRDMSRVRLRAFASNGVDTSGTLDVVYKTVLSDGVRLPQAKVTFLDDGPTYNGLIGANISERKVAYSQPHKGVIYEPGDSVVYEDGYDAQGNFPVRQETIDVPIFSLKYSERDVEGQTGPGIGTLPKAEVVYLPPDPEETRLSSKTFNPRAMVMFVDSREETDLVHMFRPYYWDVNPERNRIGAFYETYASDGNRLISGSFIRSMYNPKDHTITYYYRDSLTNRWVISVEPGPRATQNPNGDCLLNVASSNHPGEGFVFRWVLFRGTGSI